MSVNYALSSIIKGKKDFCCLCFCSIGGEPIRLNDEVVVNIHDYEYETVISEVMDFVFDKKVR